MKAQPTMYKILFLFVPAVLFLNGCQTHTQTPAAQRAIITPVEENIVTLTDAQFNTSPVKTELLSTKNISTTLKLNGAIDVPPQNLVSVSFPLGGYLQTTQLLTGVKVSRGETIATIENPQFIRLQQDYLVTKSKLQLAEADFKRQKQLNESQASSDKTTQRVQTEMEVEKINLEALTRQLRLININPDGVSADNIKKSVPIYSPINGFVSQVFVNVGKYVNPTDVLFQLIDPSDIHLHLRVFENDLQLLKVGLRLTAYTNAEPEKKYGAEIILISRDVNDKGITEVHCHFDRYDPVLIPGMYMNAEVETAFGLSDALPEESIVNFEGKNFVFVQQDKQKYKLTPVTTGEVENGFIQIKNAGDLAGKQIVVQNAYTLLMKLKNTETDED